MTLIILSMAVILTYVGVMVYKTKEIPYSISDTYYSLEHKLWFGFTMAATALLLMPAILSATPESYQFTAFLMCGALLFVGTAPNFKAGMDRPVHIAATVIAALNSQIWVALTCPWLLIVWIAWILYVGVRLKQVWNGDLWYSFVLCKPLFWAEVIAFGMVYGTLFIAENIY